jgi:leucyl aminopeptidase
MTACTYLNTAATAAAVPVTALRESELAAWLRPRTETLRRWVDTVRFTAKPGSVCMIPRPDGGLERVLIGRGDEADIWTWAALPAKLAERDYRLDGLPETVDPVDPDAAALGWALGTYRFSRYRADDGGFARLAWPPGSDRAAVERAADATFLVRDLINTPASDMGPEELAAAAASLAARHGARCSVIVGDDLLAQNYPAIHAVGRASDREPRLIDLAWGEPGHPKVTLVGKGVCFDTGGLNLKPSAGMKLMKKDMGGAANVLGLAHMVMSAGLPVRLRVLIPAVENSVSGNAMRPLDVVPTREGLTVEIGNTDAEGRVILADALSEAASEAPDLLLDFATLTGAARVALGVELPALFSNDDALADGLMAHGQAESDPMWRLPLWQPYRRHVESKVADLTNAPETPFAGAITAALFLAAFVGPVASWAHLDLMAWNTDPRPGRPKGGEAMGMRAAYAYINNKIVP